jgi:tRNA A37 threonylcarbamoyltransferase TsaD
MRKDYTHQQMRAYKHALHNTQCVDKRITVSFSRTHTHTCTHRMYDKFAPYVKDSDRDSIAAKLQVCVTKVMLRDCVLACLATQELIQRSCAYL